MTDNEITTYMNENGIVLCKDNILRKHLKNGKVNPSCPNEIYQALLIKVQQNKPLTYFQEKIYGACILSLAEIVLNNRMMKFQTPEIKEECRGQMYEACIVTAPKFYDSNKGKAYSYSFRLCYVECVHVLERNNAEREFLDKMNEYLDEYLAIENSGKKICTTNSD